MAALNAVNRGVYIADNLDFLRSLNSETVDLVCIDPPFAKNETFTGDRLKPPLSDAELETELRLLRSWGITNETAAADAGIAWPDDGQTRGGYVDIWAWEKDIHEDWMVDLETRYDKIATFIHSSRDSHSDSIAAYLCFMAIRLLEIHRVLKPTGSFYLHCDHTANGYLRQLLDIIFGLDNFRSEITWRRTNAKGLAFKGYPNNADSLLYYSKSDSFVWNRPFLPHSPEYVKQFYRHVEPDTGRRYTLGDLTNPNRDRPNLTYEWNGHFRVWRWTKERMQEAHDKGLIHYTSTGLARQKRYLDEMQGNPVDTIWEDIKTIQSQSPERTGYPTQKPIALAERIIRASSNPGDVVLDCFAGCAYSAVAAERLGRQWIACDVNPRAWTVFKRQFNKPSLALLTCNDQTTGQQVLGSEPTVTIHGPGQLPQRTSPVAVNVKKLELKPRPPLNYKKESDVFDRRQMLERLLELSGYRAWCCGFANRRDDGTIIRDAANFQLDHITPRSRGGSDRIYNRAPICQQHNGSKGSREITLERLRTEVAARQELKVDLDDLIDLNWAYDRAMEIWALEYARRHTPKIPSPSTGEG